MWRAADSPASGITGGTTLPCAVGSVLFKPREPEISDSTCARRNLLRETPSYRPTRGTHRESGAPRREPVEFADPPSSDWPSSSCPSSVSAHVLTMGDRRDGLSSRVTPGVIIQLQGVRHVSSPFHLTRRVWGLLLLGTLSTAVLAGCSGGQATPTKIYEGGGTAPEVVDQPERPVARPSKATPKR